MIDNLTNCGDIFIHHIMDCHLSTPIHHAWLKFDHLGFVDAEKLIWNHSIRSLYDCHIHIFEEKDLILWIENPTGGSY